MDGFGEFWNNVTSNIPGVLMALIILVVAFLAAWVAKKIMLKLLKVLGLDKALEKAGVSEESRKKSVDLIGRVVYLLVFALFVPVIFEKLEMNNISQPIFRAWQAVLTHFPDILAAIIVLIIGLFMAKLMREILVPVFRRLGVDLILKKIGYEDAEEVKISELLATVVYILVLVPIAIAALNALNIEAISKPTVSLLDQIITFLPRIAVAVAIILIGRFVAKLVFMLVEQVLKSIGFDRSTKSLGFSLSKLVANLARAIVLVCFIVEALNTLQLSGLTNMVAIAFIIILSTLGVAFAIAFGLGGKSFAERTLKKFENRGKKK